GVQQQGAKHTRGQREPPTVHGRQADPGEGHDGRMRLEDPFDVPFEIELVEPRGDGALGPAGVAVDGFGNGGVDALVDPAGRVAAHAFNFEDDHGGGGQGGGGVGGGGGRRRHAL